MDKTSMIYSNPIKKSVIKKAEGTKAKFSKKFGDDSQIHYALQVKQNEVLAPFMGVYTIHQVDEVNPIEWKKGIVIGNIRMGFGHYRISMAIASAAHAMGYVPYWFDLHHFDQTTGGKVIAHLNNLYSMGSRWSQKYPLFNKLYWEPLNSEGFRKLEYNAVDQKTAELMTPVYKDLPKDMPFIATHVWPAQAAVHAGIKRVVNVIPDNWPMALHLAEGAIHTVQTPSSFFGYKTLKGMAGQKVLNPIPEGQMNYVGHYIDHELVVNLEDDSHKRISRIQKKRTKRVLLTIGGAGAQKEIFTAIIQSLIPLVEQNTVALYINVGDYLNVWQELCQALPLLQSTATTYFDDWDRTCRFTQEALAQEVTGIHVFCHQDIFAAVYASNLLMRSTDLMITKPSELSFYPVPKLLIKRVGGHEAWGAVRSAEIGDGTTECETIDATLQMLHLLLNEEDLLLMMNQAIMDAYQSGIYNGAYKAVELAIGSES